MKWGSTFIWWLVNQCLSSFSEGFRGWIYIGNEYFTVKITRLDWSSEELVNKFSFDTSKSISIHSTFWQIIQREHAACFTPRPMKLQLFQKGHENGLIFNNLQKKTFGCHVFQCQNSIELHWVHVHLKVWKL